MPGQLREVKELQNAIEASGPRGVTKQDLLDILQSQAKVGGAFHLNGGSSPDSDLTIVGGWNRIDVWTQAIDTQGILDGSQDATDPGGWFGIRNAGAGDYDFSASVRFTVDTDGDYEIRVAKIEADSTVRNTPFHDEVSLLAGDTGHLCISSGVQKDLLKDERLQLEMRGPNGAIVTFLFGSFGAFR